jgi:ribosomal protein S8
MKGVMILSTSKGLLNHLEAYKISVGGEVLIHVY